MSAAVEPNVIRNIEQVSHDGDDVCGKVSDDVVVKKYEPRPDFENCDKSSVQIADIEVIYAKTSQDSDLEVLVYRAKTGFEHVVIGVQSADKVREKESIAFVCDTIPMLRELDESGAYRPELMINGMKISPNVFLDNIFQTLEYAGKPGADDDDADDDPWQ